MCASRSNSNPDLKRIPFRFTRPGHAAEDALFSALLYIRAHGDLYGFPRGTLSRLHAIGEHIEELLPWLRWGKAVPPCEN